MFLTDHLTLPEALWIEQQPFASPAPTLFAWNDALADALDLNLSAEQATQIFGGQTLPGETRSVAQAYAGHQFGQFVPQLGDGRAVLLGERRTSSGERLDVQLKGSGRTPFSRGGDGKSALGPVVREFLVSEAMHSLGVPTTRALAALTTGERVLREQLSPGGVLVRVARSHWRVGTFEFLAARGERDAIAQLIDAVIDRLYPDAAQRDAPVMALFEMIAAA
ncbi:MAG: protein adenylyltransferase SelO family protein, partial [Gammaproteobacteria bacterium]